MVFELEKPPTERQLTAARRMHFTDAHGNDRTIDRQTLRGILDMLGDKPTDADLNAYIGMGVMSFDQFQDLLNLRFQQRIAAYEIRRGPDGRIVLSRDFLLYAMNHLNMTSLQAQRYSKWSEGIFQWASCYFGVHWPPMPPTTTATNRGSGSSGTPFRWLDVQHLTNGMQFSVNVMALHNLADLHNRVQDRLSVQAGNYRLRYVKDGNVRTTLDNDEDFLTLRNIIQGRILVEVF